MKTLQVKNGDIQLDAGGRLSFLVGSTKLTQDIALWLKEDYGIGYTTSNFGSILNSLVGSAITQDMIVQIQSEVARVIGLYRSQQLQSLQTSQQRQQLGNWNKSELIQSVGSIAVTPGTGFIQVVVPVTTLSSSTIALNLLITPNGIQVQNG